jgi:hypothetical protein
MFLLHNIIAKNKRKIPWPISPNMIPKRNGNVILVKIHGLIYLYLGIPYVLIIYCAF